MTASPFSHPGRVFVAFCLWLVVALPGFAGGFTATLSTADKAAVGLDGLSMEEWEALDQLVSEDLSYARREKLTELPDTFVGRRDEAARKQTGLDKLTAGQLAKLNELVAAAIAARPTPKERPRLKESDVLAARRRGEIHGSVSVTYGWGAGGRDYRAGALWLDYYDPESRVGLGVGLSTSEGGYGYYPGYYPGYYRGYGQGYYDYDFYRTPVVFYDGPDRGDFRGGFAINDGGCLRAIPAGGMGGRGGRRR